MKFQVVGELKTTEQPAMGGRGECVPICLAVNNQFLGHFIKSDLQGQKGISKTCINIH